MKRLCAARSEQDQIKASGGKAHRSVLRGALVSL
jgi:hypothetical protein